MFWKKNKPFPKRYQFYWDKTTVDLVAVVREAPEQFMREHQAANRTSLEKRVVSLGKHANHTTALLAIARQRIVKLEGEVDEIKGAISKHATQIYEVEKKVNNQDPELSGFKKATKNERI